MEFCLLGPLLVRRGGALVQIPPGKQRVLLAALLVRANQMVSLDELAKALWGNDPPPSACATLRNYVKRLRKALTDSSESRIRTLPGGYLIRVGANELDMIRFETLLSGARDAARRDCWDRAAEQLHVALSFWRGEPLADVPSDWLAWREVPRLAEMRLQATEARVEADMRLGRHGDVIAELRQLVEAHPLRERLHALLMLALYRDGRQGEALAAYQRARRVLVAELSVEPGPELRQLELQILTADRALAAPEMLSVVQSAGMPGTPARERSEAQQRDVAAVPRQLPAAVPCFTGRAAELAALTNTTDRVTNLTVVISVVAGAPGVGKTALALQCAHQIVDQFPDGQRYVNLRWFDPDEPVPAMDALAGFLRALGVAGQDIPAEAEDRSARYRGQLAGRRVLVLLGNAVSASRSGRYFLVHRDAPCPAPRPQPGGGQLPSTGSGPIPGAR